MCGGVTSRTESISHNLTSTKQIREEIMRLVSSIGIEDGIQIQLDETDKTKLN
jgi:hypothetical protein